MLLQDQIAIINGGADPAGAGNAVAQLFAHEGATVAIADIDQKTADDAARLIDPSARRAIGIAMDAADEQQVDAAVQKVVHAFGGFDILVSSHGTQIAAPLADFEFDKWKLVLSAQLDGAFLTTRAAVRQMYAQKHGCIIYIASVLAKEGAPLRAPYVTAQHGLIGLAKVVAMEGARHGVRANVICPGVIQTPALDLEISEQTKTLGISAAEVTRSMLKNTVDGEFTTVGDVAETALFLAAFGSGALTGQSISVSNGWRME